MPVVDVARGDSALDAVARLAGWGTCPVWRSFDVPASAAAIDPEKVEYAIRISGYSRGFFDVVDRAGIVQRIFVGGDLAAAAGAFGGAFLVREPDAAWTVVWTGAGQEAVRLKPTARRDGGVFWQVNGRAAPAPYCARPEARASWPIRALHVAGDAKEGVFEAAGYGGCQTWTIDVSQPVPDPAAIEGAAEAAGIPSDGEGWIDLPAEAVGGSRPFRAWLGRDEQGVAAAHGSNLLVISDAAPGAAWLLVAMDGHPAAIQLLRVDTNGGWSAWIPTHNVAGLTRRTDDFPEGCG